MTIAPISAPTSGRVSTRDSTERRATRSSATGWRGGGAGLVSTVVVMMTLHVSGGLPAGGRLGRPPAGRGLPGTGRRELADDVDVGLVDHEGAGQRRLAAAEDVAVDLVQPQRVHG